MTRRRLLLAAAAVALAACSPASGPQTGGQTNWLVACDSSQECGALECICGACTAACSDDAACGDLPGAACIAASDEGSIALCGGEAPSALCLPRCAVPCAEGTSCVAGVCEPADEPAVRVTIDSDARHQMLAGFGASLAYAEDAIVAHPDKAALYDLLFSDSGLDLLRLRNRYDGANEADLLAASEIVAAASERLGQRPVLFMTSGSPPAALKANRSRTCGGNPATCTLASLPGGGFDYAGFASHWRASLEAYAEAGIAPDYISIQNNPDWVPPAERPNEGCRFLPEEGTTTVVAGGTTLEVAYPGYREALAAVRAAIADLPARPRFGAPEVTRLGAIGEYVPPLGDTAFDAVALHLYGEDAEAVDVAALAAARELAEQFDRPLFQTEMQAGGLETAILIHHALTAGGAAAYLQNDLVAVTPDTARVALALATGDGFEAQDPYHALSHYARRTDPGWVRVDANTESTELLSSAWLSPEEDALTVVLVNPGPADLRAELVLGEAHRARRAVTEVTRTSFAGVERSAALGELPANGVLDVPGRSIATVAFAFE